MELVNVANDACNNQGVINGINCSLGKFDELTWEKLGLFTSDIENIIDDMNESVTQAKELMGLGTH